MITIRHKNQKVKQNLTPGRKKINFSFIQKQLDLINCQRRHKKYIQDLYLFLIETQSYYGNSYFSASQKHVMELKRGQAVISLTLVQEILKVSKKTARTALNLLKKGGLIEADPTNRGTIISIRDYDRVHLPKKDKEIEEALKILRIEAKDEIYVHKKPYKPQKTKMGTPKRKYPPYNPPKRIKNLPLRTSSQNSIGHGDFQSPGSEMNGLFSISEHKTNREKNLCQKKTPKNCFEPFEAELRKSNLPKDFVNKMLENPEQFEHLAKFNTLKRRLRIFTPSLANKCLETFLNHNPRLKNSLCQKGTPKKCFEPFRSELRKSKLPKDFVDKMLENPERFEHLAKFNTLRRRLKIFAPGLARKCLVAFQRAFDEDGEKFPLEEILANGSGERFTKILKAFDKNGFPRNRVERKKFVDKFNFGDPLRVTALLVEAKKKAIKPKPYAATILTKARYEPKEKYLVIAKRELLQNHF